MPTIHDVAKRAGVASITASRVISNTGYASPETRQRVLDAANEMGYVPNRLASSLRSRRTNVLALLLTDITNPFFTVAARGVEDIANQAGYTVIFCNTDENIEKEEKYIDVLMQSQVDGIILVPSNSDSKSVEKLQANRVPVVVIDRHIALQNVDQVRCDSIGGAYQLTQLLLSLGHTHIALLNGPQSVSTATDRLIGYQKALSESKDPSLVQPLVFSGEFTRKSGYQMANQALRCLPRPTALLAANNFIALGTLQALEENHILVPQDMAIVTFDDLPEALMTSPFLTAAAQPVYEMAARATEILIQRLNNTNSTPFEEVIFPTHIIQRKSSGMPIQP